MTADAARQGTELVVFPESILGRYPKGNDFGVSLGIRMPAGRDEFRQLFEAAIAGTVERAPFVGPIMFYYAEQGLGSGNLADLSTAVLPLGTTIPASGRLEIKLRFTDQPQRFYVLR